MRKEDLKAELSKINPPEDLIRATLMKMEEAKEKKENSFFSFVKGFRYKTATLATACCALVLILGIGVMTGNRKEENPSVIDSRMGQEGPVMQNDELRIVAYTPEQDADITRVKGELLSCSLSEVTAEEAAEGIVAHGVLTIEREDGTALSADVLFQEQDAFMQLTNWISEEIYFAMVCEEKDGEARYYVTEVSTEEKN
ncbi:MAG: hypothetical protein J6J38_08510 [Lachnospiraceae bacterium]|nr:hypothetical protein [Lachnospiraceae bacterium]